MIINTFDLVPLIGGVVVTAHLAFDGEANCLEGATLLIAYLILGLAFILLPR